MIGRLDAGRVKTYLFGFAIGCAMVATILLVKAQMAARELAEAEAAAAAASQATPIPRSGPQ
jgi:hypothetical protein